MDAFNYLHIKPYCRILPYLIGLVFGYLMHKQAFRVKQLKWVSILWGCAGIYRFRSRYIYTLRFVGYDSYSGV
jgi:xanthine/uracil permease